MTVQLHLGDCLEFMKNMPDKSVDVVVTDPPYGLDFQDKNWDTFIPQWINEARRIAPIVAFTTAPTTQWDYPRPDWVGCWYRTAAQSRNVFGGFNHWTPILIYGKAHFVVDTFYTHGMVTALANKEIKHPTPKDINMMKWIIESTSKSGDIIFDPFFGSGTTGVACIQLNRHFIGCEINPTYYAIAQKRIGEAQQQPLLFESTYKPALLELS